MKKTLEPRAPAAPYRVSADCADCRVEPYVTARITVAGAEREPLCRKHAEQLDENHMLALGSARRIGARP